MKSIIFHRKSIKIYLIKFILKLQLYLEYFIALRKEAIRKLFLDMRESFKGSKLVFHATNSKGVKRILKI